MSGRRGWRIGGALGRLDTDPPYLPNDLINNPAGLI